MNETQNYVLKIKENKLQELERLGFKKLQSYYGTNYVYSKFVYWYDINFEIEVDPNRIIVLNINCGDCSITELDVLYDLFTNDMVEKVKLKGE